MNAIRTSVTPLILCLLLPALLAAQPMEPESLSQKQEIQKRVRGMAREVLLPVIIIIGALEERPLRPCRVENGKPRGVGPVIGRGDKTFRVFHVWEGADHLAVFGLDLGSALAKWILVISLSPERVFIDDSHLRKRLWL